MSSNVVNLFNSTPSVVEPILTAEQITFAKDIKIMRRLVLNHAKMNADTSLFYPNDNQWQIRVGGKPVLFQFDDIQDEHLKRIFKYVTASFVRLHSHTYAYAGLKEAKACFINEFSFKCASKHLQELAKSENNNQPYYSFSRFVRLLIEKDVPRFDIDDLQTMENIPRPESDTWGVYYETEIKIKAPERNMIQKGILVANAQAKDLDFKELRDTCILSLIYATGCRPVQALQLQDSDIRRKGIFYSIKIPFAKQGKAMLEPYVVQLPQEIASLLTELQSRRSGEGQLLRHKSDNDCLSGKALHNAIQRQMFRFAPQEAQNGIESGVIEQPIFTPTDFRHNVGHQMAMSGATADEIAYVLGHSSLVVARHYIAATPELALIKARTLGRNAAYKDMIGMIMTGKIVNEERWQSKKVLGVVGTELHSGIGGCGYGVGCSSSPVRACYGCVDFSPFSDGEHQGVLDSLQKESKMMYTLSESTGCVKRNPLLSVLEQSIFEVESVIHRCKLHDGDDV